MPSFYLPPKKHLIRTSDDDPMLFYYWPFPLAPLIRDRVTHIFKIMGEDSFDRLLDIGYGCGLLFPELAKRTREHIDGIDVHDKVEKVYKFLDTEGLRSKVTLTQGSVTKMDYPDNYFDGIIGISVLEHVKDVDNAVGEIKRVLKPGGRVYLGFPVENILIKLLFVAILLPQYHKYHPSSHTKILDCLKKHNMVIDKMVTYPFGLPIKFAWYIGIQCHKSE
jgi:ubiquinone/menaquinone biosynthesis C-methylase UbiE